MKAYQSALHKHWNGGEVGLVEAFDSNYLGSNLTMPKMMKAMYQLMVSVGIEELLAKGKKNLVCFLSFLPDNNGLEVVDNDLQNCRCHLELGLHDTQPLELMVLLSLPTD